jgi:hypothetical protein
MRPLALLGWFLIAVGVIILGMRGISYTKERETARVGPLEVSATRRGFVPPVAGGAALLVGVVLLVVSRRQKG